MSKIAEQKALEAYPPTPLNVSLVDYNSFKRTFYAKGYDQAMQDFSEKAEKFFTNELYVSVSNQICSMNEFTGMSNFIEQFKNYMQNEM